MRTNGYIKLYRREIERLNQLLDDREYRLYQILVSLADWDRTHGEKYSTLRKTVRELKEKHLPKKGWSTGKISSVLGRLKSKGFI